MNPYEVGISWYEAAPQFTGNVRVNIALICLSEKQTYHSVE